MTKSGYDLITGSSAAKNVVTVGAINGDKSMSSYSNWGPTDDGRMKPDIVAKGTGINSSTFADKETKNPSDTSYSGDSESSSGTSYASPAAAAAALLLQQYYKSVKSNYMKSATLKALLLHTAEDLGNEGPDCKFGWGLVDAEKAANAIKYSGYTGSISTLISSGGSFIKEDFMISPNEETTVKFKANTGELKASISFTDSEGAEHVATDGSDITTSRMVYKFDIKLKNITQNNAISYPWKTITMEKRADNAEKATDYFDGNMDVYRQVLTTANEGDEIEVYIKANASNPTANIPVSLVITGMMKSNNSINSANLLNNNVKIYPNPTKNIINIQTDKLINQIQICSVIGKLIYLGNEKQIDISNLNNGVYFINITFKDGSKVINKIIKD
jgi:hypothetical protein